MPKWNTWNGAFRAAGEGPLGIHYGSHVYTLVAAQDRRKNMGTVVPRTWIETFADNAWKRVGSVVVSEEEVAITPST